MALLATSAMIVPMLAGQASAAPAFECNGLWTGERAPNPLHDYGDTDQLVSVSADSVTDAWAIGQTDDFDKPPYGYRTLAMHWDGIGWHHARMPNSKKTTWDELHDVLVLSSDNAWAVGSEDTGPYGSLIEHWDGKSWTIQDDGTPDTYLNAISGLGPTDLWAAGSTNYVGNGLILHWDGHSWSRTQLPGTINFRDIVELAPNDVWAVGQKPTRHYLDLTIAMHFDGTKWTAVPTPNPLKLHNEDENWLTSIAAVSSNDIWATGVARDPDWGIRDYPFTVHWDGTKWSEVPTPDPGGSTRDTDLYSVIAPSSTDVWAVGHVGNEPDYRTFTLHWDGSVWTTLPGARRGQMGLFMGADAVASDGAGGLWAVGSKSVPGYSGYATRIWHLCPA